MFFKIVILNPKHKFIFYHFNFDCLWPASPALSLVVAVVILDFETHAISTESFTFLLFKTPEFMPFIKNVHKEYSLKGLTTLSNFILSPGSVQRSIL